MRILISSKHLAGHLIPLFPFARSIKKRGHKVLFATPSGAGGLLRDAGFTYKTIPFPKKEELGTIWQSAMATTTTDLLASAGQIFVDMNTRAALTELRNIVEEWKPDLVIRESSEYAGHIVAMEKGIPVFRIAINNVKAEAKMRKLAANPLDSIRKSIGLQPDDGADLSAETAFTYFPAALERPYEDFCPGKTSRVRTIRHVIDRSDPNPDWVGDDGTPVLFISFGTLAGKLTRNYDYLRNVLDVIGEHPVRGLLTTGNNLEVSRLGRIPNNVIVKNWVASSDVYPQINAMICHGGSGTILAGLTHGIPMVVIPLSADQPDNAYLLEASGAGIYVREPSPAAIGDAMDRVLSDAGILDASTMMAGEIASLPCTDQIITKLLGSI